MGYNGYLEKRSLARKLRSQGQSYKQINEVIHVSKDTLSRWLRDIELTEEQIQALNTKRTVGGIKGSLLGAKKLKEQRIRNTLDSYDRGIGEVSTLSLRDRFIAGVALYAGEGTKSDRICEFTNADPHMIKFMADWLISFCNIDKKKLRGAIWIHEGLDQEMAKAFWSECSGIPASQFYKTYTVGNKVNSKKIRKKLHNYGIFSIRYLDASVSRRIIGWICGLLGEAWYNNRIEKLHLLNNSPVAQLVEQDAVNRQPLEVIRDGKRG